MNFFPELTVYFDKVSQNKKELSSARKEILSQLVEYIKVHPEEVLLNYICTHNSRRSHLGQVWGQVMAWKYGFDQVKTYSGGTEATAFNPRAVAALERSGFKITSEGEGNPVYTTQSGDALPGIKSFSKVYEHQDNPKKDFCAIMTCSQADEGCPVVFGAEKRISLYYEDPKEADGTPEEFQRYDERCLQIATEMDWAMEQASKN